MLTHTPRRTGRSGGTTAPSGEGTPPTRSTSRWTSRSALTRAGTVAGALLATGAVALGGATAASAATHAYISVGSSNHTGVRCVQRAENLLSGPGYRKPKLSEDGIFGSKTLAATKQFQAFWRLRRDGIVGPATGWYVMHELMADPAYYRACKGHVPTH